MADTITLVRGMNDILPENASYWQTLETTVKTILSQYGYQEIRTPVLEKTALFCRSIGDVTDIVEKEMYTFNDGKDNEQISLRPEGTASCVRACIQHGLIYNQTQRLWYAGPMFRRERPQKGRYRQFHQIGIEILGFKGPDVDIELILLSWRLWRALGLAEHVELQINSLGSAAERQTYRTVLIEYLQQHQAVLDEDSLRRLNTNPLRVLDSKNPKMADVIAQAPILLDFLGEESKQHFETTLQQLDKAGLSYTVNPQLVRGLDYYTNTVFEWVTTELGAQGTVCAGGRYDGLVQQLGGQETPAVGLAMGMERLILLLKQHSTDEPQSDVDVYLVTVGELAQAHGLHLAERLRDALPQLKLLLHCGGGNFKRQLKKADKSGARYALILGEDEVTEQRAGVKSLRADKTQDQVAWDDLAAYLQSKLD